MTTTPLAIETADKILPFLVYLAQRGETTTYGKLAEMTGHQPLYFTNPLGYIRDEICKPRGLPLLSVLVVNKSKGVPGDSFLPEGRGNLTEQEFREAFYKYRDQVFAYQGWDALLKELGLAPYSESKS
jgi:hypothetical protein